jgi:hypothetical protein
MTIRSQTRRRTLILSVLTAAAAAFHFSQGSAEHLVFVSATEAVVLVAIAVLGVILAIASIRVGILLLGCAAIAYGLVRLVTYGANFGVINGGLSTGALLAGVGIGFIAIAVAGSSSAINRQPDHDGDGDGDPVDN